MAGQKTAALSSIYPVITLSARTAESHTAMPSHATANPDTSYIIRGMEAYTLFTTLMVGIGKGALPGLWLSIGSSHLQPWCHEI